MSKRTASDIMEKNFVTATPETSVFDLVNMFVKNHITAIPIINEKVPVAPCACQHLVLSVLWTLAILIGLNVVLISLSLMVYDVKHFLIFLFPICISSLKSSLHILDKVLYQTCLSQIFSPNLWLVF